MRRYKFNLFFTIFYLCINCRTTFGSESPEIDAIVPPEDMECKDGIALVIKRQMHGYKNCTEAMGIDFNDKKTRTAMFPCIQKCLHINEGALPANGIPDQKTLDIFLKKEMAKNLYPRAKLFVQKCFDDNKDQIDPTEESCLSYMPLIKCIFEGVTKFCNDQ